jgi:hypothetical protein
MTIKPAAWFYQYPGETGIFMCADAEAMKGIEGKGYIITPLYTHPVKELTDEEILEIWRENERVYPMEMNRLLDRSRAILKKAQEK